MPYFPPARSMDLPHRDRPAPTASSPSPSPSPSAAAGATPQPPTPSRIQIKNRRRRYLDLHPEYFGPDLELADPLLYDRMVRRFQTPAEREAEGRRKGFSGVLEADLHRGEAKLEALRHPDPHADFAYRRGADGQILAEDEDEVPPTKEEGRARWRGAMERRFVAGRDGDFDYGEVDGREEYDDWVGEGREAEERYFEAEEAEFVGEEGEVRGQTGVQDF